MTELVPVSQNQYIAPVTNIHGALQRYQDMKDFVTEILKKDSDYGLIPGTQRNTLLKPGAEKLCAFFGLTITYEVMEKIMDWTGDQHGSEPFFYFAYKVRLLRNGMLAGEGEGSCNSWEKKYRYRKGERKCPKCGKATIFKSNRASEGWYCWVKKGGCGAKFRLGDKSIEDQQVEDVPNPDIADQVNTIQKMAQKRALIAATLNTVNASDWFTQDMEDFIDGDYEPIEPEPVEIVNKAPAPQPEPEMPAETEAEPPMTIEDAFKVTGTKGNLYYKESTVALQKIAQHLKTRIDKNGLSDEDKAAEQYKLDAALLILKERAAGTIN